MLSSTGSQSQDGGRPFFACGLPGPLPPGQEQEELMLSVNPQAVDIPRESLSGNWPDVLLHPDAAGVIRSRPADDFVLVVEHRNVG